jgi:hypothetical protein
MCEEYENHPDVYLTHATGPSETTRAEICIPQDTGESLIIGFRCRVAKKPEGELLDDGSKFTGRYKIDPSGTALPWPAESQTQSMRLADSYLVVDWTVRREESAADAKTARPGDSACALAWVEDNGGTVTGRDMVLPERVEVSTRA